MHIPQTRPSRLQQGFTLIEVMLVVVLMGLTASVVVLSMGNSSQERQLETTAKQFVATTRLVLDETVLSGRFMGIVIEKDSYEFVVYLDGKWVPLESDRLLAKRQMEQDVELHVVIDGLPLDQGDEDKQESWFDEPFIETPAISDKEKQPIEPQILLFPSGEMSAFELSFISHDELQNELESRVIGDSLGRLSLGKDHDAQ